jgi:hypothetical protein
MPSKRQMVISKHYVKLTNGNKSFYIGKKHFPTLKRAMRIADGLKDGNVKRLVMKPKKR